MADAEMKKGDVDNRSVYDRSGWSETVCDACKEVILASEHRYLRNDQIMCQDCADLNTVFKSIHDGYETQIKKLEEERCALINQLNIFKSEDRARIKILCDERNKARERVQVLNNHRNILLSACMSAYRETHSDCVIEEAVCSCSDLCIELKNAIDDTREI